MCQRRLDGNKSGKDLIDCAHQRKNDDLRRLRPDGETQVQTMPKQVLRMQFQPREQVAEVLLIEQLVENSQLRLRKPLCRFTARMCSLSTKNVPHVTQEIGEIVGSIT